MIQPHQLWTIGHWTCPIPDFLTPLQDADIKLLVDIRAHPGSRRSPQFGADAMAQWLPEHGIDYRHLAALCGRRRKQPDANPTVNAGWHNPSFKNYADYTLTPEFERGLTELTELAERQRTVIMCGEPMPWRCHRLLISNVLTARGWTIWHLSVNAPPRKHVLGQWGAAPVEDDAGNLIYPAEE